MPTLCNVESMASAFIGDSGWGIPTDRHGKSVVAGITDSAELAGTAGAGVLSPSAGPVCGI
jgi:hypothetical protein